MCKVTSFFLFIQDWVCKFCVRNEILSCALLFPDGKARLQRAMFSDIHARSSRLRQAVSGFAVCSAVRFSFLSRNLYMLECKVDPWGKENAGRITRK